MEQTRVTSQQFELILRTLSVKDFGDFRRKVNAYLCRLQESYSSPSQRRVLAQMKVYINFDPNWKMEESRRQLIQLAQQLHKA